HRRRLDPPLQLGLQQLHLAGRLATLDEARTPLPAKTQRTLDHEWHETARKARTVAARVPISRLSFVFARFVVQTHLRLCGETILSAWSVEGFGLARSCVRAPLTFSRF